MKEKLLALLTVATLALAGCGASNSIETTGTANAQEVSKTDTTLDIGTTNTISGFNVFNTTDVAGQWIQRFMYPSMLDQPEAGVFEPNIATMTTEDNQTYTITVGDDVTWSDGVPFTADDIAYNFSIIANPDIETSSGSLIKAIQGLDGSGKLEEGAETISGVKVIDDKTLTITLKTPMDPAYVYENIGFKLMLAPKHVVEKEDIYNLGSSAFATSPTVAAGPYKFVEYASGSYVKLVANETYHKGQPKIPNVIVHIMDSTGMVIALQAAELDMTAGGGIALIPISDVKFLQENEDIHVESNYGTSVQFMNINNEKFDNATFRRALVMAINRDRMADGLLQGEGEVIPTTYTSVSPYKDPDLAPVAYDPEEAKKLLEESGFDTSQTIKLAVPTGNVTRMNAANLIEQDLEAIGLDIVQTSADFTTHAANVAAGDYDLAMMGQALNVDPDQSSYWASTGSNTLNIDDPTLDELITKGSTLTSFEDRYVVYQEIQQRFQEQAYLVPLYSDYQFIIESKQLDGGITPFWFGSLTDAQDWTLNNAY
ncbi:ABC transporter substrate-binding protein [Aerococcus sp. 1KP-2016]|uniref:ABC transporter substrate-binding protein n=1 Tax=Aerococcus sp. 1KP-2016 TaxID=1981982 RepID=UPI000B98E7D7|nr:ABC transporter substrate-binding protein [Aerococcus sp. 1KP-2016]OYQ67273.1 ABC transporter substrate-binding protein [Aerococcus sp. 1KP-2016]